MKKINLKFVELFLLCSITFGACKKSVAGPQGDPGTDGGKGNLVQTDRKFTIQTTSWAFNGGWYSVDVYAPDITSNITTNGEIKVYMKVNGQWWSLPHTVGDIFMEQTSEPGHLYLKYSKIHGGPPPAPATTEFRIVCSSPV
jgi:hypothetical protein